MRDNKHTWLGIILIASVLARVGVALHLGDVVDAPPLLTDQRSYHALAVRLLEGHGYSFDKGWYPFTLPDTPTAHWSFLYPLFVAAVYAIFGVHPLAARVVQAVLGGSLLPWMIYRLTCTAFGLSPFGLASRQGLEGEMSGNRESVLPLIAAAIAAVYGYFILHATTLITETFYIVMMLWSMDEGLRLGKRLRDRRDTPVVTPVRLGLSLGLAALLRQSILPWVPVLFLWLLWKAWQGSRASGAQRQRNVTTVERLNVGALAIAALVLAACIAPFTIRNYIVYDEFLLLNSNTGYAMYSAQHPMHGTSFSEFDAAPLPEGSWGRSEPALDRDLMRRGIQFVLDEPGRYLLLSLSRLRAFFEFWPTPDTSLLHNIGRTGSFGLFLPFMLYGLYLSVRRQSSTIASPNKPTITIASGLGLLYLFIAFYTLLHVLTWAMVRYRLPVDAVLLPFAALGIVEAWGLLWRAAAGRVKTGAVQTGGRAEEQRSLSTDL